MSIQDAIILTFIIYLGIKWAFKIDAKDPDFNLDDPESMTKPQRTDEVIRLIDRANSLCAVDKIPGRYVRLTDTRYEQLVSMNRKPESDNHE